MKSTTIILLLAISSCFSQVKDYKPRLRSLQKQQKVLFENIKIGDTIQIPYGVQTDYDKDHNTSLMTYSIFSELDNYECIIEGVVTDKNKRKSGYNILYKVTNLSLCKFEKTVYNTRKKKGSEMLNNIQEIKVGEILNHNMKYFKIISH